jgi:hypothetical protein
MPAASSAPRERRARPGWTTTDAMLAVAVGAALTASAVTLFERGAARVREQRFVQQVTALAQAVRGLTDTPGAYGARVDVTQRLFALGLGAEDSRTGDDYVNAYGHAIRIATEGAWFTVTSRVPPDACATAWQKMPALHALRISGGDGGDADLRAPFDAAALTAIHAACRSFAPVSVGYGFR